MNSTFKQRENNMNIKTAMKAIVVAVNAIEEDLPMKAVSIEIAKELVSLLDEEDRMLLLDCICGDAASIVHDI